MIFFFLGESVGFPLDPGFHRTRLEIDVIVVRGFHGRGARSRFLWTSLSVVQLRRFCWEFA